MPGFAQDTYKPKYLREQDDASKALLKLTRYTTDNGWLVFQDDAQVEATSFFEKYGKTLGLDPAYVFKPLNDETQDKGQRHQRYQLHYKNMLIEGAEFSLHSENGQLKTAHGRIVESLDIDVAKPMPERQALEKALADQKLSTDDFKGDAKLPQGVLLLARLTAAFSKESYRLAYSFEVRHPNLSTPQQVYVDAQTGEIVKRISLILACGGGHERPAETTPIAVQPTPNQLTAPLVASTFTPNKARYLSGQSSLTFDTEPVATTQGTQYRLSAYNNIINTRAVTNNNTSLNWADYPDVTNPSPAWGSVAQNATTAHWLTQRVQQYYQEKHQRNGYADNGYSALHVLVNTEEANASWNTNDQIRFGFYSDGNGGFDRTLSRVTADVVGHEYTHAVTQYTAHLEYANEPGAINEAISDIFGTAFERYLFPDPNTTNPTNWNWTIGEDSRISRDMAHPLNYSHPEQYLGENYVDFGVVNVCNGGNDACGVHRNSGVMNKWFHTLVTGQSPNGTFVQPVDFDKAIKIVYQAMRFYLHSSSRYADVRDATIAAAGSLYGQCSYEMTQTQYAWASVNLSPNPVSFCVNPACNYTLNPSSSNLNPACGSVVTLSVGCSPGSACDNYSSYDWLGNGAYHVYIPSFSFTVPTTSGAYKYDLTVSKYFCPAPVTTSITLNVNCGGGTTTSPLAAGCYTIKSQKTGQSLQAMADGSIKQQGGNGQANQIWKAEDAGSGQLRFTTQNGSGQVIKANNGTGSGEQLSLGGYTGDDLQKWSVQQNGSSGYYRIYRSNGLTWDLNNYGNSPELQLWGTTADPFVDYRSFRFESTGCSGGDTPPPSGGGACQESESITDQGGSVISGGNASGGQYRGSYGNQFEGLTYTFNAPSGGTYTLKLAYATAENPTAGVIVNGGGVQNLSLTSTGNWNAFMEKSLTVNLNAGNNTIRIQGGPGGTFNQDKLCAVAGNGGRVGVSSSNEAEGKEGDQLLISPNPSKGTVTVRFRLKQGETGILSVVTLRGQVLQQQAVVGMGDEQTEHIDLNRERAGMYLIRLQTDGASQIGKLILER